MPKGIGLIKVWQEGDDVIVLCDNPVDFQRANHALTMNVDTGIVVDGFKITILAKNPMMFFFIQGLMAGITMEFA